MERGPGFQMLLDTSTPHGDLPIQGGAPVDAMFVGEQGAPMNTIVIYTINQFMKWELCSQLNANELGPHLVVGWCLTWKIPVSKMDDDKDRVAL